MSQARRFAWSTHAHALASSGTACRPAEASIPFPPKQADRLQGALQTSAPAFGGCANERRVRAEGIANGVRDDVDVLLPANKTLLERLDGQAASVSQLDGSVHAPSAQAQQATREAQAARQLQRQRQARRAWLQLERRARGMESLRVQGDRRDR